MRRTLNRYRVALVDNEARGEPPTYEVRKNPGGTADDWDEGETMAVFETRQEADSLARMLQTGMHDWSKVPHTEWPKHCPRCGEGLSNTSYEPYCAYDDCGWNNPL